MRIGTWNLERPKQGSGKKNLARLLRLRTIDADLWVLTETNSAIALPGFESCSTLALEGYHLSGENFTTILSRWPIIRQLPTWDPRLAVCVEINSPFGPILAYGTIITYANDRGRSGTSKRWHEHRESIQKHRQDWLDLRRAFPKHAFVVAGDFNQSRDGSGWYEDRASVSALSEALTATDLHCLTEEDFRVSFGLGRANIDHICVGGFLANRPHTVDAWEGTIAEQRLSDHNGIYVEIDVNPVSTNVGCGLSLKPILRSVTESDAPAICAIYNPYVVETVITFEQTPVSAAEMAKRIREYTAQYPWLVAELDSKVVAYAYATRWRTRAAYDFTLESTIYVDKVCTGRGIAKPLYMELLRELRVRGLHAVVGCIALPNDASVALHEKCGFVKVAHFPQVGRKFDRWVDVGFWQATLNADQSAN